MRAIALWLATRPAIAFTAIGLLLVVAAFGLPHFQLDASADALVLEDDPNLRELRDLNATYGATPFLIVAYKPHGPLFDGKTLDALDRLVADLEQVDGVTTVLSIFDAPLLFSPPVAISELEDGLRTLRTDGVDLEMAADELTSSELFRQLLIAPDGQSTAIQLLLPATPQYDALTARRYEILDELKTATSGQLGPLSAELEQVRSELLDANADAVVFRDRLVGDVRSVLSDHRNDADIYLGGVPMIAKDVIDYIRSDMAIFGVLTVIVFALILAAAFRSVAWTVIPLVVAAVEVGVMMGLLGYASWPVTVISSNVIALLMILTISLTVHLGVRLREIRARMQDANQPTQVAEALSEMAVPCFYTSLTTGVAFASLMTSGIRPVIDFGAMMALGMAVAYVLSFALVAVLASVAPPPPARGAHGMDRVGKALGLATANRPRLVALIAAVLGVVAVIGITQLRVENSFVNYFDKDTEIYRGMLLIDQEFGGTASLDIVLSAPELDAVADPVVADEIDDEWGFDGLDLDGLTDSVSHEYGYWYTAGSIRELDDIHTYLDGLPGVGKVLSLASGIRVAEQVLGFPPGDIELSLLRASLPPDLKETLLRQFLSDGDSKTRISMRIIDSMPGLQRAELIAEMRRALVEDFGFQDEQVQITGIAVMYSNMLQRLYSSQIGTIGVVLVLIGFMLWGVLRDWKLAVVGMLPNVLAAGLVLSTLGWLRIPLDVMTITVAAICVGIAVDNSIHYLYRLRLEFARAGTYAEAIVRTNQTIGAAMTYTAITIAIGLLVLTFSNFVPAKLFGILTAMAMILALAGAVVLIPACVKMFQTLGEEKT